MDSTNSKSLSDNDLVTLGALFIDPFKQGATRASWQILEVLNKAEKLGVVEKCGEFFDLTETGRKLLGRNVIVAEEDFSHTSSSLHERMVEDYSAWNREIRERCFLLIEMYEMLDRRIRQMMGICQEQQDTIDRLRSENASLKEAVWHQA